MLNTCVGSTHNIQVKKMSIFKGKVWGTTEVVLSSPFVQVHKINIHPNSHCSEHAHLYRSNTFIVVSGELEIHVRKNDYALTDVTVLKAGDTTTVPPNEYHWFVSRNKHVVAYEVYFPEPVQDKDIVRNNVGGSDGEGEK